MARRKKDSKLDTRSARAGLVQRREPYWCSLSAGLALGYRKGKCGGRWVAKHYGAEHGRRYCAIGPADDTLDEGAISFDEAQADAREWLAKLDTAGDDAPKGPYKVNQACDAYLEHLRGEGRGEAAVADARRRIDAFIRPELGIFELAKLKAAQLRKWRSDIAEVPARIRTKPGQPQRYRKAVDIRARKATANRTLAILKAALNLAFDDEHVASNAAWGRRVKPFKDVTMARIRFLQVIEAKRLVVACDPDFRPLVQAALQTGARYSELTRLKVGDFDADEATIFIAESKSGRARHVRLSDEGVKFFRQLCAGRAGDQLIFRKSEGQPWLKSHQSRPMIDACERAKITPRIGFHGLRHTYASLHVKNGARLHIVALNLGHMNKDGQPDVRMVTRHYAHLEKSDVAAAIRKTAPKFGFKVDSNVVPLAR